MPCFGCDKCDMIKKDVLLNINAIVAEYNEDYEINSQLDCVFLAGRLKSYLEINEKFFHQDLSSIKEAY